MQNDSIAQLAADIAGRVAVIRRDIHAHPETKYEESRTAGVVESFLGECGISSRRCAGTGVVAVVGKPGVRVVALRSEMDALPMRDDSGLPHASVNDGVAHACGHDGHIAVLLGVAWALKQMESNLPGAVKLIWQPAEEGGSGAARMIADGVLDDPAPGAIFGMHGWPMIPAGKVGFRFGSAMASTDDFTITVRGKGTHGAMPHAGVDPVVIAARVIEGIQLIRSRMVSPLTPLVITVGTIHGGSAVNVIPDKVTLAGTIRTLDPETRQTVPEMMARMASHTALASGGVAEFQLNEGYPPVVNDERATAFARDTLRETLGPDAVFEIAEPVMGGEDFAYYLERIPGTFLRIGVGDCPPLHNPKYDFNDAVIPDGIRALTGIALRFLETGLE